MTVKTFLVSVDSIPLIQAICAENSCEITEIGQVSGFALAHLRRITLTGPESLVAKICNEYEDGKAILEESVESV